MNTIYHYSSLNRRFIKSFYILTYVVVEKVSAKICMYFPKDARYNHFSDLFNDQAHEHYT
jgi:hypothetical protein